MMLLVVSTLLATGIPSGTICQVIESKDIVCKLPDGRKYYCIEKNQVCIPIKTSKIETI